MHLSLKQGTHHIPLTLRSCVSKLFCQAKSLRTAIDKYIDFYNNERPQGRYDCKTPTEVRLEALAAEIPALYPIPENKQVQKYKEKWMA